MTELTPRDFEKILDADGNINSDELSVKQKKILAIADIIKQIGGSNAKTECFACKGTRRSSPGSPFPCTFCNGTGWR